MQLPAWRSIKNLAEVLLTPNPLQSSYCWHPDLAQRLREMIDSGQNGKAFDLVHVEHLRGAPYGLSLMANRPGRALPVVWDSVDCISLLFRLATRNSAHIVPRLITRVDLKRTERYEGRLVREFSRVVCTSPKDREALLALSRGKGRPAGVSVIPNGVDLSYFQPDRGSQREPATLVISGKMSYHANSSMVIHFTKNVLPLIWAHRSDVRLCVAGKDPPREIRRLADDPRIEVTGTVQDIRPFLRKASLAVAPLTYGVGIQNKVLEAMACALPVACSPQAVTALSAVAGRDIVVAENSGQMARVILDLLDNPDRMLQVGWAGRQYVEANHRWEEISHSLERVYEAAVCETREADEMPPIHESEMQCR